jgi:hypothetical protein
VAPRNETDVKSPAHIDCEAERIAVKPTGCQDPGTGHFAVLVNSDPIPAGEGMPNVYIGIELLNGETGLTARGY